MDHATASSTTKCDEGSPQDSPHPVRYSAMVKFIDIMRTVFPVAALASADGEMARPDYFGTAFAIRPDLFVTAAHVVKAAVEAGALSIGGPTSATGPMGAARVAHYELFAERDIALLFMNESLPVTVLPTWLAKRVQFMTDLGSFGYPHAVTHAPGGAERLDVVFRAYRGHVITIRGFERLADNPAIYEMSCPYPEGLSGAPVMLTVNDELAVAGVVLGSSTVTYGGVDERVGVAVVADELFGLRSDALRGTLGEKGGLRLAAWALSDRAEAARSITPMDR